MEPVPVYQRPSSRHHRQSSKRALRRVTYNDLGVVGQVAIAHTNEGVVLFTFTEGGAVNVSREPAEGREDAGVEGGLGWQKWSQYHR